MKCLSDCSIYFEYPLQNFHFIPYTRNEKGCCKKPKSLLPLLAARPILLLQHSLYHLIPRYIVFGIISEKLVHKERGAMSDITLYRNSAPFSKFPNLFKVLIKAVLFYKKGVNYSHISFAM